MPEITDSTLVAPAATGSAGPVGPAAAAPAAGPAVSTRPGTAGRPGRRGLPGRGWYRLIAPVAIVLVWQLVSWAGLV